MLIYFLQRLIQGALTLVAVAAITFVLMHAVPGGPFDVQGGDRLVSPDFIRAQEAYYGLDRSVPEQFGNYLSNLLHGDLGLSFAQRGQPVTDLLLRGLKPSLILGTMAFVMVVGVGVPVGVISASRRNSWLDYSTLAASTVFAAVPSFVLAFVLLLLFAVWLNVVDVRMGAGFGDSIGSLPRGIIPAFALAAPQMALVARLTRGSMLEVINADYMRTARAKGLSEPALYWRHAIRNALIPVVTLLGPVLAGLVTGSIIIESIFSLPGIGSAFVNSIGQRDYGVIMGTTLFFASVIVLMNVLVDLAYPFIDPRVRLRR